MRLKPINQQVVLVMGASSGIGRAAALKFARRGARLVVSARGRQGLDSLVEEVRRAGGEAISLTADVTDFEQVKRVADLAAEHYGGLDTWVHAAAVSIYASFEQTTPEEFRHIIDTNLNGQAYGAMAALPHIRRGGRGALIHVSSVEARRALPLQSAYAASKHGMKGFLEALRVELQHEGADISVTEVMPSSINTPFFNKARTKLGVKPKGIPPIYQPDIVADAILYAAEHPVPEIVVGGAGKAAAVFEKISPRMVDSFLSWTGFEGQRTNEPKAADAPDNLYQSLEGYDRVEGDFSDEARETSLYTWLATHRGVRGIVMASLLGCVALLAERTLRSDERKNPFKQAGKRKARPERKKRLPAARPVR